MSGMTESNPKMLSEIITKLGALENTQAKVGWFESAKYESGRPVAAVAAGNELGIPSRSIPPRPFFRPTEQEKKSEWENAAATMATRVLEGKATPEEAMEVMALKIEGDVLETISKITQPPLSPITLLARKRRKEGKAVTGKTIGEFAKQLAAGPANVSGVSTKPLDDTGHMIATLTSITERTK